MLGGLGRGITRANHGNTSICFVITSESVTTKQLLTRVLLLAFTGVFVRMPPGIR